MYEEMSKQFTLRQNIKKKVLKKLFATFGI